MYYFIFTKKENEPARWAQLHSSDTQYTPPSKTRIHEEWQEMIDGENEDDDVIMDRWTLIRTKLKIARLRR